MKAEHQDGQQEKLSPFQEDVGGSYTIRLGDEETNWGKSSQLNIIDFLLGEYRESSID